MSPSCTRMEKNHGKSTGFPAGNEFWRMVDAGSAAEAVGTWNPQEETRTEWKKGGKSSSRCLWWLFPGVADFGGAAQSKRSPHWPAASQGKGLSSKPTINSLSGLEIHGLEDALDLLRGYTVSICTVAMLPTDHSLNTPEPVKCCSCFDFLGVLFGFCFSSSSFFFKKKGDSQKVKGLCILEAEEAPGFTGLGRRWCQGLVPKGR